MYPSSHILFLVAARRFVHAAPPGPRQVGVSPEPDLSASPSSNPGPTPSASPPSTTATSNGTSSSMSIVSIIVPVVAFILLMVLLCGVRYRKKIRARFTGTPVTSSVTQPITADRINGTQNTPAAPTTTPATRAGRRNVRRTDSGVSVKTLPAYSKEVGDQELVLVRHQSAESGSELGFSDSGDEEPFAIPSSETSTVVRSDTIRSARSNHSRRSAQHPDNDSEEVLTSPANPDDQPQSAIAGAGAALSRIRNSISRRGWGEAPTYLEAMSSPDFPRTDAEEAGGVPPPRASNLQRASSGLRNLLSQAGLARSPSEQRTHQMQQRQSQTSLLLQPHSSRLSTMTGSTSPYESPWASTQSLVISSPLPNSAVRASFDAPEAGFTPEQVRFLSTSEARDLAGTPLQPPPQRRRRRASSAATRLTVSQTPSEAGDADEVPPPTWEEVDGERRKGEAEARKGLARPIERDEAEAGSSDIEHEQGEGAGSSAKVVQESEAGRGDPKSPSGSKTSPNPLTISITAPDVSIVPPTPIESTHAHAHPT